MSKVLTMRSLELAGKRVLIREDLNVPIEAGVITSTQRLEAALPALKSALERGASVLVMSHLGRPKEGVFDAAESLAPIAAWLSAQLGREVPLVRDYLDGVEIAPGELKLLENVRMNVGEAKDDETLSRRYAALCDIFVNDAFGTAHRAQASTHGVAKYAPVACAGPLLEAELDALARALEHPARPLLAIVGGSKVSTKLELLGSLIEKVEQLIVGGGIANTFLAASGLEVGKSLYEADLLPQAREILAKAKARGVELLLPVDVVSAGAFSADAAATTSAANALPAGQMILDVGPASAEIYRQAVVNAGSILWNGPLGVFEFPAFSAGTKALAEAIAQSKAFSIAGGGDTLAAIEKFGIESQIDYISTGGGAFLEFIEGKPLPAVAMLEARAKG